MKAKLLIILFIHISLIGYSQANLVGQKAPPINIENWIYPKIEVADWQIKDVPKNLKGKIIVLDFWFTKCAPCVASIPELNHLAKQFPEVVFLSITFDKPDEIDRFLNQMIMYYPVGSDPERKTINAYGVRGYPETFLIDKNGIIIWQGSPFDLDKNIINKALGRETEKNNLNINNPELPFENSAYSFSIQKHNMELEMGSSSYSHYSPFDINVFNYDLERMLEMFYGINKLRILTQDSALLKTTYDLTLKADKDITTHANCVEMLKYLLPKHLNFELKEFSKDTIVGVVQIGNDSLLNTYKSADIHYTATSIRYDNWESKGVSIEELKDFLENNYSILLSVQKPDDRKFDFIVSAKDFEEAKKTLENDYGLIIKFGKHKMKFWEIVPN